MKKIICIIWLLAISLCVAAQGTDFVTKTDFEQEKQQLNAKIKAARAPTYELRSLYQSQQSSIDSLFTNYSRLDQQAAADRSSVNELETKIDAANEDLSNVKSALNLRFTWLIVLLCLVFLVSLLFLYLIWVRMNRKMAGIETDQEKTNEALNLHVKNTEEEVDRLTKTIQTYIQEADAKLKALLAQTDDNFARVSAEIQESGIKADEKIQTNKASIIAITSELEARTTQLAISGNELKIFIEKALMDVNSKSKKLEESMLSFKSALQELEKKHDQVSAETAKNLKAMTDLLKDHDKKGHK